jgi:hypothetical protein
MSLDQTLHVLASLKASMRAFRWHGWSNYMSNCIHGQSIYKTFKQCRDGTEAMMSFASCVMSCVRPLQFSDTAKNNLESAFPARLAMQRDLSLSPEKVA